MSFYFVETFNYDVGSHIQHVKYSLNIYITVRPAHVSVRLIVIGHTGDYQV